MKVTNMLYMALLLVFTASLPSNSTNAQNDKKDKIHGNEDKGKSDKMKGENTDKSDKLKDKTDNKDLKADDKKEVKADDKKGDPKNPQNNGKPEEHPGKGNAYGHDKENPGLGHAYGKSKQNITASTTLEEAGNRKKEEKTETETVIKDSETALTTAKEKITAAKTQLETDVKNRKITEAIKTEKEAKIKLAEQKAKELEELMNKGKELLKF